MRTFNEIVNYARRNEDIFGFAAEVLVAYLPAEEARAFCKPDADLSDWKSIPLTRENILADMQNYMEFAWEKVQDHRGLSAGRSVQKMAAWLFLLEDTELWQFAIDSRNYAQYGAPILKKISEKYNFPVPEGEDVRNMSEGRPCTPDCQMGCGR